MSIKVSLTGSDSIEIKDDKLVWNTCEKLNAQIKQLIAKFGADPKKWPVPTGQDHSDLLIKKFIQRVQGTWPEEQPREEICHCRNISLQKIEDAIAMGAVTVEMIGLWTSAGTACGTCQPELATRIARFRS